MDRTRRLPSVRNGDARAEKQGTGPNARQIRRLGVFSAKVIPNKLRRPLALMVVAVFAASACSNSAASPTATTAPTTPGQSAAAPTATVTPTTGPITGSLTVMGTWSGDEETSFRAMIQPWVNQTGVQVKYTGTSDLNASLSQGIK